MQVLTPLIAPLGTFNGPISSTVYDGAITPSATAGTVVWSASSQRLLVNDGTRWKSDTIPIDVAASTLFVVIANMQVMLPAVMTIEGTLTIQGTVALL